jgi:hypothetical protein
MACDKLGGLVSKVRHLTWSEVEWLMSEIKKVFGEEIE